MGSEMCIRDRLGDAGLPPELWALVFVTAAVSWACAEGVSRLVWRAR